MVSPAYKGVFVSSYEAARDMIVTTIIYLTIIFNRELYSALTGKPIEGLLTERSYILIVTYGSLLYIVFVIFWSMGVYRSIKHYRKKQRDLKILLEEQHSFSRKNRDHLQGVYMAHIYLPWYTESNYTELKFARYGDPTFALPFRKWLASTLGLKIKIQQWSWKVERIEIFPEEYIDWCDDQLITPGLRRGTADAG